ncbi:hypothetical protein Tco_0864715 [Tanacetum coccineum]
MHSVAVAFTFLNLISHSYGALEFGFYNVKCQSSDVEDIVRRTVAAKFFCDRTITLSLACSSMIALSIFSSNNIIGIEDVIITILKIFTLVGFVTNFFPGFDLKQ